MLKANSYRAAARMATASLSLWAKMVLLFLLQIILNPNNYSISATRVSFQAMLHKWGRYNPNWTEEVTRQPICSGWVRVRVNPPINWTDPNRLEPYCYRLLFRSEWEVYPPPKALPWLWHLLFYVRWHTFLCPTNSFFFVGRHFTLHIGSK